MQLTKTHYLFATIFLFITEILIAKYIQDKIIRPYIGDVLVVILIYCFVKSIFSFKIMPTALGVLIFSFAIEFAQYFNIVSKLGLQQNRLAVIVIGNSFSLIDLLCYVAGIGIVLWVEKQFSKKKLM